jgi:outer membrane protein assembly factor BamD (BamD/ComL family)
MGLKPAAIKAFKELTDGFPGSPEARTAQQELADLGF